MKPLENVEERPLSGQVAVVTGAGSGIGEAIARRLAAMGATVVPCGRRPDAVERVATAIRAAGGSAQAAVCDVTSETSVQSLAGEVTRRFGRVDILVNNAGVNSPAGKLHELSPEGFDRTLATNLRGVFLCMRAFTPLMLATGGHIINISSLAGKNPLPGGAAYAASKWGLNGLSYSAAEELRELGIRVAVVCPASTATDFSPHAGKDPGNMLQPDDVAHAVAALVTQAPQSFMSEVLLRPTRKP